MSKGFFVSIGSGSSFQPWRSFSVLSKGFTLIEVVVVIVILGILAATALPKFIDLSTDANKAAIAGVAGALNSAGAINSAGCAVTNQVQQAAKCAQVQLCTDAGALLTPPLVLDSNPSTTSYYTTTGMRMIWNGCTLSCMLYKDKALGDAAYSAPFTIIAAAGTPVTGMGCIPIAFGG